MMNTKTNERSKLTLSMWHLGRTWRKKYEGRSQKRCGTTRPTAPFKLAKHKVVRKRNWSDSSGNSLVKTDASRRGCQNMRRINSSYKRPVVSTVTGMKPIGILATSFRAPCGSGEPSDRLVFVSFYYEQQVNRELKNICWPKGPRSVCLFSAE